MMINEVKNQILSYKEIARNKLLSYGIKDNFTIKIKDLPNENWVALYRTTSQYRRLPIFWISPKIIKNQDEFIISVLHEYGHVIAEDAYFYDKEIFNLLSAYWSSSSFKRPWEEEEFAEQFAQFVFGNSNKNKKYILKIIQAYVKNER